MLSTSSFLLHQITKTQRYLIRRKRKVFNNWIYTIFRFRFFCEDHHRKLNTSGHSEWFLTRYRLK